MQQITAFSIDGLHGAVDVNVPIAEGKVILVGVNGLGKTTIVSMLYFVLTRQWQKLLEYEFDRIIVRFGDDKVEIERDALDYPDLALQASFFDAVPVNLTERIVSSRGNPPEK
jgi:recombinational DNA repair ATPase RecF